MAIDQDRAAVAPEPGASAAIENELPAYRAVSGRAVASVVFGALAVLCFADLTFLVSAALAVVLGLWADRKIQRQADVLTGRAIAQAGVALGLIFGLASTTVFVVQRQVLKANATRFAKTYLDVLRTRSKDEAYWWMSHPLIRKGKTPEVVFAEFKKNLPHPEMLNVENAGLNSLRAALAQPGGDVHFAKIERAGTIELDSFAAALLEVHGAAGKGNAPAEQFALLRLKCRTSDGKPEWWVEKIEFPYKPDSFSGPLKPVDDGHGHGH